MLVRDYTDKGMGSISGVIGVLNMNAKRVIYCANQTSISRLEFLSETENGAMRVSTREIKAVVGR